LKNQERGFFRRRRKWRPAGTIKVWDDDVVTTRTRRVFSHWEYYNCGWPDEYEKMPRLPQRDTCKRPVYKNETVRVSGGYVPVEGVRVRARRWFTTHTGISNAQGRYSCSGRFRRPAKYFIKWKRHDFSIRWSSWSAAKYRGPKKTGEWNLNIRGGTQEYYATIFRAAHHYYYKNIKGLRRPPQNYSWRTQLKIKAVRQGGGDCGINTSSIGCHTSGWRSFGLYSPIKIYTYGHSTVSTYATTIHELAHASHWITNRYAYNKTEDKVKESWATGVQWELTRMVYPDYKGRWRSTGDYTLVVSDMIDTSISDDTNYGYGYDALDTEDEVSGYTIRQIEDALKGQKTWNAWRDNIISKYGNTTEDNLNRLFRAYE